VATTQQLESIREEWAPTREKVDRAVKAAIEIANPSRVFLFGSWPRGEATPQSDLDLAVFVDDDRSGEIAAIRRKIGESLHGISMDIDLIIAPESLVAEFMSSVNSVYYKIVHGGKLVYGSELRGFKAERKSRMDRQAEVLLGKAADDEAVILVSGIPDGPFGFHVQQAIEKLLKALISQLGLQYERTHDLEDLVEQLQKAGETLPMAVIEFSKFQRFAVIHRYDDIPTAQVLDRKQALETVRILREHVVPRIAALSSGP
jgi:predicted nucleotidyltransferase